jgi:hypothetical protein
MSRTVFVAAGVRSMRSSSVSESGGRSSATAAGSAPPDATAAARPAHSSPMPARHASHDCRVSCTFSLFTVCLQCS